MWFFAECGSSPTANLLEFGVLDFLGTSVVKMVYGSNLAIAAHSNEQYRHLV